MNRELEMMPAKHMHQLPAFCGICKRSFMQPFLNDSLEMDKHDEDIAVTCPRCFDRCRNEGCKGKRLKDSSRGSDYCSKCQWIVEDVDESSIIQVDVSTQPDALDNHDHDESVSNHPDDFVGIEEEEEEEIEENIDGNGSVIDDESKSNNLPVDNVGIEENIDGNCDGAPSDSESIVIPAINSDGFEENDGNRDGAPSDSESVVIQAVNSDGIEEVLDEEENVDGNKELRQLLAKIRGICNKVKGGMGSDGKFGSTNAELKDSSCIKVSDEIGCTIHDVFMDVGSSSGLTQLRFSAIAGCKAVIGVEIMGVRHMLALKSNIRVMEELPSIDLRTIFCHNNILDFDTLNGVTILYMFDAAIPDTEWVYWAPKVNKSTTITKMISSKNNLKELGFDVDMVKSLGDFPSIGGHLNRVLYLYRCKNYNPDLYEPNNRIENLIQSAANRELRLSLTEKEDRAYTLSQDITRTDPLRSEAITESLELYNLLTSDKPVRSTVYKKVPQRKKHFQAYSRTGQSRELNKTNTKEFDAFTLEDTTNSNPPKPSQAIIAPSYDPDSQTILVSLLHDERKSQYLAILYDVRRGILAEKSLMPERSLYSCYRWQTSVPPVNLHAAVNEYRLQYPLSTDEIEKEKLREHKTPDRECNANVRQSSQRRKGKKDSKDTDQTDNKKYEVLLKEKADTEKKLQALKKQFETVRESLSSVKKINASEKRKLEDANAMLSSKLKASEDTVAKSRSAKKGGDVSNGSTSVDNRFHQSGAASGVNESILNLHTSLVQDHAILKADLARTKRSFDESQVDQASFKRQCVEKDSTIESLQVKNSQLTELLLTAKDEKHKDVVAAKDEKHKDVVAAQEEKYKEIIAVKDASHKEVKEILQSSMADALKAIMTFAAIQKSDAAASAFIANSNTQSTNSNTQST